jgi:predicted nucleic-acid-binding protein
MNKMVRIDTNYIIRYLINDDEEMAAQAETVLLERDVFIANEILAEVVYVLSGVYKISKSDICEQLSKLLLASNIFTSDKTILINALAIFQSKNLDFVDCLLCAYSKKDDIMTFDKKLQRCVERENLQNK